MRVVWDRHPITAAEVIEKLTKADASWHPKTVRTLLGRLVRKQALAFAPQARAYVYRPKVSESQCVAAASESFLERVFGGALAPMLSHFVQNRKLSKREIEELRRILGGKSE